MNPQDNALLTLLQVLVNDGTLTGQNIQFAGVALLPLGDEVVEPASDEWNEYGLSDMDEIGLVRVREIEEGVIPRIRKEMGEQWAAKVPQKYAFSNKLAEELGYKLTRLQTLNLRANANYAYFIGTPLIPFREVAEPDMAGRRWKYIGVKPNARYVRDSRMQAIDELPGMVYRMIKRAWQNASDPDRVDFSPN